MKQVINNYMIIAFNLFNLNIPNIFVFITDEDNALQRFCLNYELETNQLQITIYETLLSDDLDISQITDDEFCISNLILSPDSSGQYCVYFQIDPIVYDFR